jgi:membrane-bound serine protease (ClpP class)
LTAGGVASFLLGSLLLFNTPEAEPFLQISLSAILGVTVAFALFFGFVVGTVLRSQKRKPVTGREGLVGQVGEVRESLEPRGMVFVGGELWRAVSTAGPVPVGGEVQVVAVNGLTLTVTPLAQAAPVAPGAPAR